MAGINTTSRSPTLEYVECPWGDLITGARDDLQMLGLGAGLDFPRDGRGRVVCRDPRGFRVEIRSNYDGRYFARVELPGRQMLPTEEWKPFARGVKFSDSLGYDAYLGTAEALCAAGLAKLENFPGQPGMRKTCVTIYLDGTVATGHPNVKDPQADRVGVTTIRKQSNTTFRLVRRVADEEHERQWKERNSRHAIWERRMEALPRPAPLVGHTNTTLLEAYRSLVQNDRIPSNSVEFRRSPGHLPAERTVIDFRKAALARGKACH